MTTSPPLANSLQKYLPFLLEIRKRLLFLAAVFFVAASLGFINSKTILQLVLKIFHLTGVNIVFTSPFQYLELSLNLALLVGLVFIFPFILIQLLSFLRPALKHKELRLLTSFIPLSIILFLAGFGLGIIIMRYVIAVFYQKSLELNIGNFLDVSLLLSQALLTGVLMGLAFQFPLVITFLIRLKIIARSTFARQRIAAYALSLTFAALLPPTDLLSLLLLTLPLALLFEFTLLFNRLSR